MVKVQLSQVELDIRNRLNKYKADNNAACPDNQFENLSDVLERLLDDSKMITSVLEQNNFFRTELVDANKKIKELERENHVMRELREVIIPIPREVMNSTPEDIDSLDLSDLKLEDRLKMCWKRFANFKEVE